MATFVPKKIRLLCPAGTVQAVCYDFWDLGFQKGNWKGKPIIQPKVCFAFELNKKIEEGQFAGERHRIMKRYTNSLEKKSRLKVDLESWLGKPFSNEGKYTFDLESMVGKNCFLSIIHDDTSGDTYANIASIMSLPEGVSLMQADRQRSLPDWVKELKSKSVLPDGTEEPEEHPPVPNDEEIPF